MKSYGNMFLLLCATILFISDFKSTEAENHNPITKIVEHTNSDPCICDGSAQLGARFKPRYNSGTFTSLILSNTQVGYKATAMQDYTPESTKIVPHTFGNLCGGKYKWLINVNGESFTGESFTVISASTSGTFIIPGGGPVPANVSISGNASPYNTGDTVTLTANTTTTLPPVSYIWTNPAGHVLFTTKTIAFTAGAATAGLWTVEVYTDNQQVNCSTSVSTNIVVTPPCDLMISATGECNGLVYVSGTGAQASQMVTIFAGTQALSPTLMATTGGSFSGTVGPLAPPGMYTITAQTATPCISNGVSVTINPNPAPTIMSSATSVCQGQSVMLTASPGFASYQWFINGVLSPDTTNVLTDIPLINQTSYYVTVTDSHGCQGDSNTIFVTVNPNPLVTITGNMDICGENPPTLTAMPNDTSTYSYLWTFNGNPFPGNTTPTINPNAAGTYAVTVTNKSTQCSGSAQIVTNENLSAGIMISPSTFCIPQNSSLSLTAVPSPSGTYTYSWTTPTGPTTGNPINASVPGTYTVTITDPNCSATASVALGQAFLSGVMGSADCQGTVTITGLAGSMNTIMATDGTFSGSTTADAMGNFTITIPNVTNGMHTFTVTATDASVQPHCTAQTQVQITVNAAHLSVTSAGDCLGNITVTGAADPNDLITITGDISASGTADGSGNFSFTFPGKLPGTYNFTVTATNNNCMKSMLQTVMVPPCPTNLGLFQCCGNKESCNGMTSVTVSVKNAGPAVATGFVVTETLPCCYSFLSSVGEGWTFVSSGNTVTATFHDFLGVGAATSFTLQLRANCCCSSKKKASLLATLTSTQIESPKTALCVGH